MPCRACGVSRSGCAIVCVWDVPLFLIFLSYCLFCVCRRLPAGLFVISGCLVKPECLRHRRVALPVGMNAPKRYRQQQCVVDESCQIKACLAVWQHEQVVAAVVIILAISDRDMIVGVDLMVNRLKTPVAGNPTGTRVEV